MDAEKTAQTVLKARVRLDSDTAEIASNPELYLMRLARALLVAVEALEKYAAGPHDCDWKRKGLHLSAESALAKIRGQEGK